MTDFNQKTHDTDVGSYGGQSRQMMEVFENQEFGSIRVLQEAGKIFFCASDVAFFQNGRLVETKDAETFWEKPECEETKEFLKG